MTLRGAAVIALLLFVITGSGGQSAGGPPSDLCGHTWEAIDDVRRVHYSIGVCEANICGQTQAAICAHDIANNSSAKPVGNLLVQADNNVLVFNTTQTCPESEHKVQSVINLVCWKSLGTPEFIKFEECVHYFEWRTFAACKKNKFKPGKEVPCYVFDTDYRKHDLNPLIKTTGGYLVEDSDEKSSLYINICRNIGHSGGDTAICPSASAACILKDGKAYDVGQPKSPLKSNANEKLILQYETASQPEFCGGHKPSVTITFICPTAGTQVSGPKLTANHNCRYEVEWVTENACHVEYLETNDCKLISKDRGVSVDLSPLNQKSGHPYHTEDAKGEYVYYLNVCGKTDGGDCSAEMSSCQIKKTGSQKKGAGSFRNQTLRYSDGDITLTYPGGEQCSSGFQRMTVINFECNETAENDGKGEPEFDGETDCTYFFTWETKYACPKKREDLCHIVDKKQRYNLFNLIRNPVSDSALNWEAENINPSDKSRFFINVCHEVLQKGDAVGCDEDAAVCAVDSGAKKNLGKFLSPPKLVGDRIVLEYTEGSECGVNKRIQTNVTLICSPGDLESAPILKHSDGCLYEFEWNTAAACVLSKREGDNCRVSDSNAGFYFDLSPLTQKNGSYHVTTDLYDFYLNVCSNLTQQLCDAKSGACQVSKSQGDHWNIGVGSSKLSYYDGMIQLSYVDGSPYNDGKETPRSSLITFLCDRDTDIGQPEYQKEDNYTYNFKWYTKYACPALSVECIVVDEKTNEQYDLSSLSKVHGQHSTNWYTIDMSSDNKKKYYINVCRSLIPVPGCDPFASVCQMSYVKDGASPDEHVEIGNFGMASKKPVIESSGKIKLEYTNGSKCDGTDGVTTYSTVLHLVCKHGATSNHPIYVSVFNCESTFLWYTEAACPIVSVFGEDCKVEHPNTGFVYNLESLKNDSGYITKGNGKTYKLNICGPVQECGSVGGESAAGCELESGAIRRPVKLSQKLDLSADFISLTYNGALQEAAGKGDTFIINFVCNDDLYPGELVFKREEINSETGIYNTMFDFKTAMACSPSLVDCQVTDPAGNEYDLSDLGQDTAPWIALDTSDGAEKRTFYINVCKPLPYIRGCPGGLLGSCMMTSDNKGFNLGFIQMSPQASSDGTLTIVYMSGDKCGENQRYSTRILFQCDHNIGSPVFQEKNGCEYVFLWRTSEACPVVRAEGDNCQVKDPKYGHVYDLKPLGAKNVEVNDNEYTYQLRVCGEFTGSKCASQAPNGATVSSCQVKGSTAKLAGLTNQKLIYEDGVIMLNYSGGDLCHQKYNRTTLIIFTCDKKEQQPVFTKETSDCIYTFQWRTPLACPPFKPIDCSFKDPEGNSYDLSPLSDYAKNWNVESHFDSNQRYRINICKPLVLETGPASCPYGAAACLINGTKGINLGEPVSGPKWENDIAVLQYKNGDRCPDGQRNKTTTIRFMCNSNQQNTKPKLITALEDCDYNFLWSTNFACKLKVNTHDDCKVTNPNTGHLFDLSTLSSKDGYEIKDNERSIQLNICDAVKSDCDTGSGVCVTEGGKHLNAGKAQRQLTYIDQVLKLVYGGGDQCTANPSLNHQSIFTFVCAPATAAGSHPSLVLYSEETCTWQFTWHTSLVCEKEVKCSVQNGTSEIDLSPLMKRVDNYIVLQGSKGDDIPDFYINICQPLNENADVKCPLGTSACRVTSSGQAIDIGRPTSPPVIDMARQTVSIKMDSLKLCDTDAGQNYSTLIIFHCNAGADLGNPKFVQQSSCTYLFEWATPLVCSDEESISGCSLMDQQLHYTFNLSSLSGETYQTSGPNPYYIGVCSAALNVPSGKCSGSVCLPSGNTAFSFGNMKTMKMGYYHREDILELQYTGGDLCPPVTESGEVCLLPFKYNGKSYSACTSEGKQRLWCPTSEDFEKKGKWGFCSTATDNRRSTILFKCDEHAGKGLPVLVSETKGCSATFEWKTQLTCVPKKLDCKFIIKHKTYDFRMLSSLTGSWAFTSDGSKYYLNLCQRVNKGPSGCSENAAVCQERNGKVYILGQVHTQTVNVTGEVVSITYSNGDHCDAEKRFSTTIELNCANVTSKPIIKKYISESCRYIITWETRSACAVLPKEVSIAHGIIHVDNELSMNLSSIYLKSYNASGDIRAKDQYIYEIQLSGKDSAYPRCSGASVCQVKINGDFTRAVGSSVKAKYYVADDDLEVFLPSNSKCGKDPSKNATSTIFLRCSQIHGEGKPEFLHESADCQYLFSWYTAAVCPLTSEHSSYIPDNPNGNNENQYQGLSGRSQAVGAILSILLVTLVGCLVVLLLYKKERRDTMIQKLTNCCRRSSSVSYKYTKINTEEEIDNETEWLMEEVSGNHGKPPHENGHVRSVKAEAFTSLHVDDLDSEDEVLTLPDVRIKSARIQNKSEKQSLGLYTASSDENLLGVVNGGQQKTGKLRSGPHKKESKPNIASFHDDSDEDMLNV